MISRNAATSGTNHRAKLARLAMHQITSALYFIAHTSTLRLLPMLAYSPSEELIWSHSSLLRDLAMRVSLLLVVALALSGCIQPSLSQDRLPHLQDRFGWRPGRLGCTEPPSRRAGLPERLSRARRERPPQYPRSRPRRARRLHHLDGSLPLSVLVSAAASSGKAITSRIDGLSVSSMTSRSMPMPSPPHGGRPYSSAVT